MSPLQFLPQLKRWVSLEGFYEHFVALIGFAFFIIAIVLLVRRVLN